ncbi:MAG: hypothetical protein M1831_003855 [Alyxoria varia]|nr:MAG: hypothetical protein M1831_003855 [Alyxoria varia]
MATSGAIVPPEVMAARNSSIDSTMSSMSSSASASISQPSTSTTHSHKSSQDTAVAHESDAASFIVKEGGAEKAVERLLQELKDTKKKYEQLWDLMQKQRSMMHGLHKDWEKALKEKERYRKRLKEYSSAVPAVPSHTHRAQNPSNTSTIISTSSADAARQSSSPRTSTHSERTPLAAPSFSQKPPVSLDQNDGTGDDRVLEPMGAAPKQSSASESAPPQVQQSPITPMAGQANPLISSPGEKSRKPVPAPLDLSQTQMHSPTQIVQDEEGAESGSDYGDNEDSDGVPTFERGRRRTREDDERQREAVSTAEEQRSKSNKSNKGKNKSKSQGKSKPMEEVLGNPQTVSMEKLVEPPQSASNGLPGGPKAAVGLPSSPRAALLGQIHSPRTPTVGSIAAAFDPSSTTSAAPPQSQAPSLPPPSAALKSPGLPTSPRPVDNPLNSPASKMGFGLPQSPRAPRQFGIQPPQSAMHPALRAGPPSTNEDTSITGRMEGHQLHGVQLPPLTPQREFPPNVNRGFVSHQYPHLLLPPNALPFISVKIISSRGASGKRGFLHLKHSDENAFIVLGVYSRSSDAQMWRVEKPLSSLPVLDSRVKNIDIFFSTKVPDKSIFNGKSPAQVDAARTALMNYFDALLNTQLTEKAAVEVCDFFSHDVFDPEETATTPPAVNYTDPPSVPGSPATPQSKVRREGVLAKKGKKYDHWIERKYVLEDGDLRHYDSRTNTISGYIRLAHAQVFAMNSDGENAEFRHAFCVKEPKRRDPSTIIEHILYAESDDDRDKWVNAIMTHVEAPPAPETLVTSPGSGRTSSFFSKNQESNKKRSKKQGSTDSNNILETNTIGHFQSMSYDDATTAAAPVVGTGPSSPIAVQGSSGIAGAAPPQTGRPTISGPVAAGPIQNVSAWGGKSASPTRLTKEKETKKRSMFSGFLGRSVDDSAIQSKSGRGVSPKPPVKLDQPIFGRPLAEVVQRWTLEQSEVLLPAPLYRCIQYLRITNASREEGLFRVGGSNAAINELKVRFNTYRDVNLLSGESIDIPAVASLLKRYLRIESGQQKLAAIKSLLHKLPAENYDLLSVLMGYLGEVVKDKHINKMTTSNLGIVFVPTLHNIPNTLLILLIEQHATLFGPQSFEHEPNVPAPESMNEPQRFTRGPSPGSASASSTPRLNQAGFNQANLPQPSPMFRSNPTPESPRSTSASRALPQERTTLGPSPLPSSSSSSPSLTTSGRLGYNETDSGNRSPERLSSTGSDPALTSMATRKSRRESGLIGPSYDFPSMQSQQARSKPSLQNFEDLLSNKKSRMADVEEE